MSEFHEPIHGWICDNPKGMHLQTTQDDKPPAVCVRPTCGATGFEPATLKKPTLKPWRHSWEDPL